MTLKIEEANDIVAEFEKESETWRRSAITAWDSLKQEHNGLPYSKNTRKKRRFPLWWSTTKVRQPILYSNTPIPVASLSGDCEDPIKATQARIVDILAHKHIKLSPFDRVMQASRDDLLQANVGVARVILTAKKVSRPERVQVQQVQDEQGQVIGYQNLQGEEVDAESVQTSEEGFYIETEGEEDFEQETAMLKAVCCLDFGWDYESKDFGEWDYCFFKSKLSTSKIRAMLKDITGEEYSEETLIAALPECKKGEFHKSTTKHDVIELWHKPTMKRYIFSKGASAFIAEDEDPYELPGFFPLAMPLFDNLPTDCMIPVVEHAQLASILENIDELFSRISNITRMIRARGFYDSQIPEISQLISSAKDGDYIAIANLAMKLKDGQVFIQYLDISPLVESLSNLYQSLAQELQRYDELTQLSDLARGATNPYESATAQERKAQFTLNRYKQLQSDIQRFAKDNIKLTVDLALANYSEERLKELVYYELDRDDQSRYDPAIKKLKASKLDQVVVDIETNSTIAINEEEEKARAIEFADTLSRYLSALSQIVVNTPFLTEIAVKAIKKVIRAFRGGRQFEEEMERAVQAAIDQAEQMRQQQPGPTLEEKKLAIEQQKLASNEAIKRAELQLDGMIAQVNANLEAQKLQLQQQDSQFKRYIEQATLELKKTIETLGIQERFTEEERLSRQQLMPREPQTVIVPPEQTNVVTPQALTVDGV